jgi:general secretion pathway protein L
MPTWLGIDIGSASVKVAVVRATYRKTALVRLASAEVVRTTDASGPSDGTSAATRRGQELNAVSSAVQLALEGEKQGPDAIAVAIEGSRAAIHRLSLPATAQKQLADVLAFELEAQIPFDIAGAVFDWRVLERGGDGGQLSVLAAVARVEDVRARIDLVKSAIVQEPERVGVGAFVLGALAPYVAELAESEAIAVVDLGAKASEVLVIERGEPVFARTVSIGTEGLPATAERLARDLRVSFGAHRAQGGAAPTRVLLCGGGAFVSGAESFLSNALEMPVKVLPDPAVDLTAMGADATRELPRYAKAVALALGASGRGAGLNLRRGPLAFERGFAWVRERIPVLVGLACVILVSFVFSAWSRLHAANVERDNLTAALGTVTKDVLGTEATTADDAQDLLSKATALNDEDPMPHADAFDVMVRLSQAIPTTMKHDIDELDVQKGHVTVHGVVGSVADAQTIATNLGSYPCFTDVKLKNTTQAIATDRQKYVLELDLKCPEDQKAPAKKKAEAGGTASAVSSGAGSSGGK